MSKLMSVLIVMFLVCSSAFCITNPPAGEQIVVNTNDIPPAVLSELRAKSELERIGKYAGLGKEIGEGVNGALSAITENVDKIGETRVGKITIFLVVWKVMGFQFLQVVVGLPLLFVITIMFVYSYRKNCTRHPFLTKELPDKTKIYVLTEFDYAAALAHSLLYLLFIGLCALIIFAH